MICTREPNIRTRVDFLLKSSRDLSEKLGEGWGEEQLLWDLSVFIQALEDWKADDNELETLSSAEADLGA